MLTKGTGSYLVSNERKSGAVVSYTNLLDFTRTGLSVLSQPVIFVRNKLSPGVWFPNMKNVVSSENNIKLTTQDFLGHRQNQSHVHIIYVRTSFHSVHTLHG